MTCIRRLLHYLKTNSSLTIIITAALLLELMSAVQYYYMRGLLTEELEKRAESEMTTKAIVTKSAMGLAENSLNGHLWDMKSQLSQPDSMFSVAEWLLRSHPNLLGCGMAFTPYFYPEKGRLYEPYVYWKDDRNRSLSAEVVRVQVASERHDYTKNALFQKATQKPIWTDPYLDEVHQCMVATYSQPIRDEKDSLVAVFGLDIALVWLGDTLNYRHMYPHSYDLLLTETGQLIAGPRDSVANKQDVDLVVRLINDSTVQKEPSSSGLSRTFSFKSANGDDAFVYFATFRGTPRWRIAVVCYDDDVYDKVRATRLKFLLLMLAAMGLLGLMVWRFSMNDRRLQKISLEQERIGSELRIATEIQHEMLPRSFSLGRDDIDIYGSLTPAREVGGDLFDFFLRDEKLFFCIGDVSGKGIPSAMVMAVIHSLFRMASAHENNPSRIMQTINETSCIRNDSNIFVTLFIGILDLPTGHLRYCNAGHDKPAILDNGPFDLGSLAAEETQEWRIVDCKANIPVGLFEDYKYVMEETILSDHAMLFLYTDGLTEAKNVERKLFGLNRVMAMLETGLGSQETVERMKQEVETFCRGAERSDDLTMLAIRYEKVCHEVVLEECLVLQNDVRQVKALNAFVQQVMERLGVDTKLRKQIKLAVEESVVNVMDYAYPPEVTGDIEIQATSDNEWLKFVIMDNGVAFDPTGKEKADTTLSVEDRPIGGMGILLVRELMDSINYERTGGKNVLTLKKRLVS